MSAAPVPVLRHGAPGVRVRDCERDAAAIRIFVEDGHKVGCSQSFARTWVCHSQRIGCFSIMCSDAEEAQRVGRR